MENKFYIFTEAFNCGKILSVCLESYHKHHDLPIHIIGTAKDFLDAGEIINHPNNILVNWDNNNDAKRGWSTGHMGTALSFATAMRNEYRYVLHFDADCYFKNESLKEIIFLLEEGNAVVGTPRPYGKNLSGIRGLDNQKDCISTYLMGIDTNFIPSDIDFETLTKMCGGWHSYTGERILDFFDPVVQAIYREGGNPYFLDTKKYGGIDLDGSKFNGYLTNLNFDCGDNIVHFGGVGTGKAVSDKLSEPPKGYADWSYYRWNFYSHLFFDTPIDTNNTTVYSTPSDHNGQRWCDGPADNKIIFNAKKDIALDENQILFKSEIERYFKDGADEALRYRYNLDSNSVVFDIGGYLGDFADVIRNKFSSKVFIFEPVQEYYNLCRERFLNDSSVNSFHYGIGGSNKNSLIYMNGDATSSNIGSGETESIEIRTLKYAMESNNIERINLMKINIEGDEYALLESAIEDGLMGMVDNIQVQYHLIDDHCQSRKEKITEELKKTHDLEWKYDWVWESWKIRK